MGTQGIIFWQFKFIVEQASSLFSSPKNCLAHQISSVELASCQWQQFGRMQYPCSPNIHCGTGILPVAAILVYAIWAYAIRAYPKICNDSDRAIIKQLLIFYWLEPHKFSLYTPNTLLKRLKTKFSSFGSRCISVYNNKVSFSSTLSCC